MMITIPLRRQQLTQDPAGHSQWQGLTEDREWDPAGTALLICDMWDNHWSRGAAERVEVLAPRMDRIVRYARSAGVTIIHAPSDTLSYYEGSPARQRMMDVSPASPPPDLAHEDPPLPIDDSDGGSDTGETPWFKAWSRQHPAIRIDQDRDAISDSGKEVWSYLHQRGIGKLLILGVHTNMCVLHRTFGIKQMVRWGIDVALIRDLTDTMYNPARSPYVSHDEGTRLVIEYIEKFWCPTVGSGELRFPPASN